jgi:hypothetical protein
VANEERREGERQVGKKRVLNEAYEPDDKWEQRLGEIVRVACCDCGLVHGVRVFMHTDDRVKIEFIRVDYDTRRNRDGRKVKLVKK